MAVFPESMNKLDPNDVPGSLTKLENYIRYMTERTEFSMRNMTRNVNAAGTSTVETLMLLNELASALSIVNSTVNGMVGEITTTNNRVTELQNKQTDLETKQDSLESTQSEQEVKLAALEIKQTAFESRQTEFDAKMTDLQNQITVLAERVTALEGGTEG